MGFGGDNFENFRIWISGNDLEKEWFFQFHYGYNLKII